jgi:hypothetical protein
MEILSMVTITAEDEDEATSLIESVSASVQDAVMATTPDLASLMTKTSLLMAYTAPPTSTPPETVTITKTTTPSTTKPAPTPSSGTNLIPDLVSMFGLPGAVSITAALLVFAMIIVL